MPIALNDKEILCGTSVIYINGRHKLKVLNYLEDHNINKHVRYTERKKLFNVTYSANKLFIISV